MNPTLQQVHSISEPLTDFSLMMMQSADGYVADKVFPVLPVTHQASTYYTYPRAAFNRPMVKQRAPGSEVEYADYEIKTATYETVVYALGKQIDEQIRKNADPMINLDVEATMFLTNQMLLKKELLWANAFFTDSAGWTTTLQGVSSGPTTGQFQQWDQTGSNPIVDIRNAARSMRLASGNVIGSNKNLKLVLGRPVYDAILDNAEIVSRIQYSVKQQGEAAVVTKDVLAQLFEVQEVLVMDAIQNTAAETLPTDSETNAFIGGNNALLLFVPGTPGLRSPAAGLNFTWSDYGPSRIISYEWLPTKATRVEAESAYQYQMVSPDLGAFFYEAIS
jgi:hypothetical protein